MSLQSVQWHYSVSTMIPILNLLNRLWIAAQNVTLAWWCFGTEKRMQAITKRTGFDFKVDTKHCTTGLRDCTVKHPRFCFVNSLGIYPEIWSIANLYSPVWGVILLKRKEQWGGESTPILQFWPQSINRIKSSRCQEDFTSSDKQWDESSESCRPWSTSFKVKKI